VSEPAIIELDGVDAGYGRTSVLHSVSLQVSRGEVVTLLGANGAGKSTTLRLLSGVLAPRRGRLLLDGRPVSRHDPRSAVLAGVAHAPEGRRIFPALTVRENVELGAAVLAKGDRQARVEEMLALFPRLAERVRQQGGTLSGGEQQMLAIARALAARPRLLMLDEPSLGLAPLVVAQVAEVIRRLRERGTTVLLVEQNAALALSLADRAYILENGRISLSGPAAEMLHDPRVRAAYLGHGAFVRQRRRAATPPGPGS